MARYKGKSPKPYNPSIKFNLRQRPEGGDVAVCVNMQVEISCALTERNVYVMIHGFNNHQGEAEFAYQGFRDRQSELLLSSKYKSLTPKLRDTFWPGDAEWYSAADKVDFLVYPSVLDNAYDAGNLLASFLVKLGTVSTVNFIGHSLGCRVVFETMLEIQNRNRVDMIGKVVLMAAAVPQFMLERGGRFERVGLLAEKIFNLTSKSDLVLKYAFPPGQTAADPWDEGFFPNALGRHGVIHPNIKNRVISNARHGDYWGHSDAGTKNRTRGARVNKYLAEFFKWTKFKENKVEARKVAFKRESKPFNSRLRSRSVARPRKIGCRRV